MLESSELDQTQLKSWQNTLEKKIKECEKEEGKDIKPELSQYNR